MTGLTENLPERVGPYRVIRLLGQGGMGSVYEAEETGPVRRRVAVKVVRSGVSSREVLARFETERQALALMNHPGIASVLAAGTTESGEPYFSMEIVRGLPITEYADAHRLTLEQRLTLFIAVCQAVQHAHQKGVIHRDLKPSNLLVTEAEAGPQPKVIDFGIAKALGQRLTEHTLVTTAGLAIGTAMYMSPEQADPVGIDIDTRADIYSLGVVLYELLVGELPLEPGSQGVYAFLARLARRETDPPIPSARFQASTLTDPIAHTRRTDPTKLRRALRGDLDWIVMRAIHPERAQRYETANGLAEDLRRHLDHQPVTARPPSTRYRVEKFVRRHRVGVIATGVVTAAIIGGSVLATIGFVRARRAEHMAAEEAATAQQVTAFLMELFSVSDPGRSRGDTLTARELLSRGANRVYTGLTDQPLLQARLMQTLGSVHQALGMYVEARPLFDSAVQIRERELGANDLLVAEALRGVGEVARRTGDLSLADSAFTRALAIREAALGPEHVDAASILGALAALRYAQGNLTQAESLYTRVIPLDTRLRPPNDPTLLRNLNGLAVVHWGQGRYADAEPLFLRVLETQVRSLGPDHYDVGGTLNNLGGLYYQLGRYDDALRHYERARPVLEKSLPPTHPTLFGLYNNIGETYWKLKRYSEAEALLRQSLATKERVLVPGHASIATTLHALAGLLRDEGKYRDAEPYYRQALEIRDKTAATNPLPAIETLKDYAELLRRSGRPADAARLDSRAERLQAAK